jgi:hypothetical protein
MGDYIILYCLMMNFTLFQMKRGNLVNLSGVRIRVRVRVGLRLKDRIEELWCEQKKG